MFRRVLVAAVVLLSLVAATSRSASSTSISPCRQVSVPTWSPDGQQIAFYGKRWPPPSTPHRNPNDILQAFCVMGADGTNAQPLRYTVCSEKCQDPPYQMAWLPSGDLVYLDGDLFRLAPGQKPKRFARVDSDSFATDPAGHRITAGFGFSGCLSCGGPVTVLNVPSGQVVGKVGGKRFDNVFPSLSPDGKQVVFQRDAADDSGRTFGVWTAKANGKGLRHLVRKGFQPLWSPATGGKIAFRGYVGKVESLRLASPTGRGFRTLVPRGVSNVFGWSPDGKSIAFEKGSGTFGKLAVVNVVTGKVRQLLKLYYAPTAVWKPDSSELLAYSLAKSQKCWSLTRVPVGGSTPTVISTCNS